MSDKIKKLFKAGFFDVFGASLINNIINFLAGFILIRILSKPEYGLFTYVWNIYNLIMLLCGLGFESGFLQIASERSKDSSFVNSLYGYSNRIGNLFNLLLSALMAFVAIFIPLKMHDADKLLLLISLLPLIQFLFRMLSVYLRSLKENRKYAVLTNINTILVAACTILGAYTYREKGLILGYYVAFSCTILVALLVLKIPVSFSGNPGNDEKRDLFNISIISVCNNSLSQLLYLLDVFMIGIVISDESILATYKVATVIPTAMMFIPQSVIVFIYPYFAEHRLDKKWCVNNYKKLMFYYALANVVITSVVFLLAPFIITVVHGSQYLDAVPAFRILVISYFFSATFRTTSGNLLVTQRKLTFNLIVSIITGLANVVADYFFITNMGSIGAAYATLAIIILGGTISTPYLIHCFANIKDLEEQ